MLAVTSPFIYSLYSSRGIQAEAPVFRFKVDGASVLSSVAVPFSWATLTCAEHTFEQAFGSYSGLRSEASLLGARVHSWVCACVHVCVCLCVSFSSLAPPVSPSTLFAASLLRISSQSFETFYL